ncbi:hypothetical protein KY313_00080 [Candidatus Woesearchaeota archaeon]|jgi:hypothetical protein|nr:hypothetical protein [Candidatus Woesearchaeota archaeon]
MPSGKREDDLLDKYKRKIELEMGGEVKPSTGVVSREYSQFKKEMLPAQFGFYERACNFSESLMKIAPKKDAIVDLEESIDVCHLNITPTGVMSLSILGPLAFIIVGSLISFTLIQDMFFIVFFLFFGLAMMSALQKLPNFLANSWRMKASNQMVLCVFYVVTYMRHTSNLENAIDFSAEHLAKPLSLDMKKVLWDVETQKYESIRDSLDHYLDTWKKWNREFIEAMHLIESSLYEGEETRRLNTLDKSLSVILDGTYEKMLHYSHNLKGPITMLHMMGVILPILGLVILPLVVSFMEGVEWYHISLLYNVALPVGVLYIGTKILAQRPTGYGDTDIAEEHPELKKERNIKINLGFYKTMVNPLMLSLLVGGLLFMIGISPLLLHMLNPSMDFDFCIQEGKFKTGVQLEEGEVKGLCLLDYKENKAGKLMGPFGVGAALLGVFVPLSVGLGIALYFYNRSKNVMEIRNRSKQLEAEFASALFQLGGRLGDGIPTEMAFSKVAASMEGTTSGDFFKTVDGNIKRLGMGVEAAIFDPKYGALKKFPSKVIESSMKVLIESAKKGPRIASEALTNVSRYLQELHKVDEKLKDLMGDIVGSMKSQVKFLTPVISGIVVGITSMISSILGRLQGHLGNMAAESGAGMSGGITNMFGVGLPTYFFQIVVGLYVVELGIILIILSNGIENGVDKLMRNYRIGTDLKKGVILYCCIAVVIMFLFNMIADTIMGGTL